MNSTVLPIASESAVRQRPDATESVPASLAPALLLRNRDIGILCDDPRRSEVIDLQRVATGMGARVALVRSDLGQAGGRAEFEQMARVLAGFYDAVLCFDLPPSTVRLLGEAAAIPVVCVDGGEAREPVGSSPAAESASCLLLSRLASLCA